MQVYGFDISEETFSKAQVLLEKEKSFSFFTTQKTLESAGVPVSAEHPLYGKVYISYRAADRWLQKMRKAGLIKYEAKKWHWNKNQSA